MKSEEPATAYEPSVAEALRAARQIRGGIMPRYLARAIPPVGKRRSHLDTVCLVVLVEVMDAYRFPAGKRPYWSGPAYAINRAQLARIAGCTEEDVSRVITHLAQCGFVLRRLQTRRRNAEMAGKRTLVVPDFRRISAALATAESHANYDVPFKAVERALQGHLSPNGPQRPEGEVEPGSRTDRDDGTESRGPRSRLDVERGGGAAPPTQRAVDDRTSIAGSASSGQDDRPTSAAAPGDAGHHPTSDDIRFGPPGLAGKPDPYNPAAHARQFADLFAAIADRSGRAVGTTVSAASLARLTAYFRRVRLTGAYVASIASYALYEAALSPGNYPVTSAITEPVQFVYNMARIQREVGVQFSAKPNNIQWCLMFWFTPSELPAYGVPNRILDLQKYLARKTSDLRKLLWLHNPAAADYYVQRSLAAPEDYLGPMEADDDAADA